jgi:preprotein translocase subunit SecF
MRRMQRHEGHFDFIGRARMWFIISGILVVISLGSLGIRKVNAGLEFRGGTAFRGEAKTNVSVSDVRSALDEAGVHDATIQKVGDRGILAETEHLDPKLQTKAVNAMAGVLDLQRNEVNVTDVGPKWGAQITSKAVRALIIFLIVVVLYLTIRLELRMAGAAMLALFHDVVITAGVYSLSGFEVTPSTVIALLTILGYSLYDTVVIFDRVKDHTRNLSAAGRVTYSQAANEALNQVLVRSLNTSIVSLLPVGSLLFVGSVLLGASTLRELALALFIGIAVGTYSSIFVATPALALLKEREPRWATLRARLAARSAELTAPPRTPSTFEPVHQSAVAEPVGAQTVVQSPGQSAASGGPAKPKRPKGQAGRRKKKKRRR